MKLSFLFLGNGIKVLEIGSNNGTTLNRFASDFPKSIFKGIDVNENIVQSARDDARNKNLTNVSYEVHDVYGMPPDWNFDYVIVFDVLHDLQDPTHAVQCIYDIIKPGGHFSLVDNDVHSQLEDNISDKNAFIYSCSLAYCLPASLHQGGSGAGLAYGQERFKTDLTKAGFKVIAKRILKSRLNMLHFLSIKQL